MKKLLLSLGVVSTIPLVGLTVSCGSSNSLYKEMNGITYQVNGGKLSITYHYNNEQTVWEVMDRIKLVTLTDDSVDKEIASHFPLIDNPVEGADIYTNLDTNELFKLITITGAPESFMNQFRQYQTGELQTPVAEAPNLDEHGNIIPDEATLSIDLDTMTKQEAIDWLDKYNTLKTQFNVNIDVNITRSGAEVYHETWTKGIDREHSNYGRGWNIDIYGPGDEFYNCYFEIQAAANEQP